MKITIQIGPDCSHQFRKADGSIYQLPGQEFKGTPGPEFPERCNRIYVGPVIVDKLPCEPEPEPRPPYEDIPEQSIVPFNIHGFLTKPALTDGEGGIISNGRYSLDGFFGVPLYPPIPPGNAFRTRWRLHTDTCGFNIEYFVGDLDDNGHLLATGTGSGNPNAFFDQINKDFVSNYVYPEGMYLQLGVIIDDVLTWAAASPCISGGNGTP